MESATLGKSLGVAVLAATAATTVRVRISISHPFCDLAVGHR
jgi:hypothetical protein